MVSANFWFNVISFKTLLPIAAIIQERFKTNTFMKKLAHFSTVVLLLICFSFQSCKKTDTDNTPPQQTIKVGALLSLTGNWSSLGINSKAALEIAAADINSYME